MLRSRGLGRLMTRRRIPLTLGTAVGTAFAAALIGLANAPVAGAEGGAVDTAVDNFLQGIANVFAPEVDEGGIFDPDAGFCGTLFSCLPEAPGDQMLDAIYLSINTAFQPEGSIDVSFDQLLGTLGTAAADPAAGPDIAISFSGIPLLNEGTAFANSGPGDIAVAIGANSSAQAFGGIFNSAFADGTNSSASMSTASGIFDSAFADGTNSTVFSGGGSLDAATAVGNFSTAVAGLGSLDFATVFGNDGTARAEVGSGDLATIINTGSSPDTAGAGGFITLPIFGLAPPSEAMGSGDIAFILGTGSTADAGANTTTATAGNFDLAAVFGDMAHAIATGGNFLTDIAP